MEKGIRLKKSRFNYSMRDEKGDIVLCNFAKGMSSFCKIDSSNIIAYNMLMNSEEIYYDQNKEHIVKLVEKGLLVPANLDEMETVNRLYYNSAMDSKMRIIIMPTEQCNFRCKYCYETYQKGKMSQEDQLALLKFIQRQLNISTKLQISWFGGEPLEAKEIVFHLMTIVNQMCKKKNIEVVSDMTTNAYNLDADTFDNLYRLNIRTFQITLDGLKGQHDKQRVLENGEGTFEKIVNNLRYIKNNYEKFKFASISIRVNISREILNNLRDFIEFYRMNFGNDRRFSLALTPINDMGGDAVKEIKGQFVDTSEVYRVINELNLYADTSIQISNIYRAFSPSEALCYASRKNTYVVGSDLSLYKCTVHFDMPENNIGQILPNGEAQIDEFRNQKWYVNYQYKDMCKACFLLPCCFGGGCPHKRNFFVGTKNKCVLPTWKQELKNAIKYISARSHIETINISD